MYIRDVTNSAQLRIWIDWIDRQISDNAGTVTLATGATSTTVQHGKVTPKSVITLTATTANAAAALATTYVVAANGSFVLYHANAATTDRKFNYSIFGV